MIGPLSIMVLEHDPKVVSLIAEGLADTLGPRTYLECTTKLSIVCESLTGSRFDAIIVDLDFVSGVHGLASATALVNAIRMCARRTPLFVLLEQGREQQGIESIHAGANGCLFKNELGSGVWLKKICGAVERRKLQWIQNI
ncbi:MAG: hypothetical protein ACYDD2_05800 [Candidatus Acidiferrales bacterium]